MHAVPAAPLVVNLSSFVFLVFTLEVTAEVHQCVSECLSFVSFLRIAYLYMQLSLFTLHSVSFDVASDDFVSDSFTYIVFLYLRY